MLKSTKIIRKHITNYEFYVNIDTSTFTIDQKFKIHEIRGDLMSFKDSKLIKKQKSENNTEGMSIRKKIPLLIGSLIFISTVITSIVTYIVVTGDINEIRQPVNQMTQRILIIAALVGIFSILIGDNCIKGNSKSINKGNIIS